jgi:3-hydroxyisobutyrate dehydrogenase-like beta-hydroxyacid dehydrogenase
MHFGILHPGQMGITVALSAVNSGHQVYWASKGRSPASARRAAEAGLLDAGSIAELCAACDVIASVCPPEFAEATAEEVARAGFRGLYLDANAISPERARRIGESITRAGADFVDGGIIGLPAQVRGRTWLCLSGPRAADAAACFAAGPLETELLGDEPGRASALKMCFAAWTKGTTAMLCVVLGAASHLGVLEELQRQWTLQGLPWTEATQKMERAAPKAWRWAPEMREIAATFAAAGMEAGFHEAAEKIYKELAGFKGSSGADLGQILARINPPKV